MPFPPPLAQIPTPQVRPTPTPSPGQLMAQGGKTYLNGRMQANDAALAATGIGLYYGNNSAFSGMTAREQAEWVERNRTSPSAQMPRKSSCIDWAMENVGGAYKAAGQGERWKEIQRTVYANGGKGTVLAAELQKDGWESAYFNPDTKNTPPFGARMDSEHKYTADRVNEGKPYYGIRVDHKVVDYAPAAGTGTTANSTGLDQLRQVPFFFGISRGGEHTFVGQNGRLNELHWRGMPNDAKVLEERGLESIPQGFTIGSGVVMVPPGTWPKN
jgi:hypothetical protein